MTEPRTLPPEALNDWSAALAERFDLGEGDIPISLILDLAREPSAVLGRECSTAPDPLDQGRVPGRQPLDPPHRTLLTSSVGEG